MTEFEAGAEAMRVALLAVAENVVFRPTQDPRAKDGRIRCSVDDLLIRLAAVPVPVAARNGVTARFQRLLRGMTMNYLWLLWPLAGLIFFILYGSRGFWLNMRGGTLIFFITLVAGPLSWLALLTNIG